MVNRQHKDFLSVALGIATQSKDTSSQNGAIIVDMYGRAISSGCNNFPEGVEYLAERLERPAKYQYFEHAERNAIYKAARSGRSTQGATMYCPWAACHDCARAIIQSGICCLVRQSNIANPQRWAQSCEAGDIMLREAGIEIIDYEGFISGYIQVLRDGVLITP